MPTRFVIRAYAAATYNHVHDHHQLVIPLSGAADEFSPHHEGRLGPGQCIVYPAGTEHQFVPDEQSRYLVVDMDELPSNMRSLPKPVVALPAPVLAFCHFVESQLEHRQSAAIEASMAECFFQLLSEQDFPPRIDPRIARVLEYLQQDLSVTTPLTELAERAHLSLSQFKALFKKETGKSAGQYLLTLRMEKAKALLVHTDRPIKLIAEAVSYQDLSAFSHRFSSHFGHSPSQMRSK